MERLDEKRVSELDVLAGIHVHYLQHLADPEFALEDGTIRLAAGVYDLGAGAVLEVITKRLRLLGDEDKLVHPPQLRGEGAVIRRDVDDGFAVETFSEGVVIEQVSVRSLAESNMAVLEGSATVAFCDVRGSVLVDEGAKMLLKNSVVHGCSRSAVYARGTATIQGCTVLDNQMFGIHVKGEATVTGTTVRRCGDSVVVVGKATLGEGCQITDNTSAGIVAWKDEGSPAEVTVEAGVVCEGNNSNDRLVPVACRRCQ